MTDIVCDMKILQYLKPGLLRKKFSNFGKEHM